MDADIAAVVIDAYGGPEVMRLARIPRRDPGAGEVAVRVRACGVNPVDWKTREGARRDRGELRLPLVLGCDLAGEVTAVGEGVAAFRPGDAVFGMTGLHGAFAEEVVLPATHLAPKPQTLDFVQAAAVPLAALTAWQAMDIAGFGPGQRLLVQAASGGVGAFAVQIARARGAAAVFGTCSAGQMAFVRGLGATPLDRAAEAPEAGLSGLDMVLDLVGGAAQARSWAVLRPGGWLVTALQAPPGPDARRADVQAARVGVVSQGGQLAAIGALIDAGRVAVRVAGSWPFSRAAEALERSRSGAAHGKLVLLPGG